MSVAVIGCGGSAEDTTTTDTTTTTETETEAEVETEAEAEVEAEAETGMKSYADIVLGEDFTDLTATISFINNRTDLDSPDYGGVNWAEYLAEFNKVYPNITVNVLTDTNYAETSLTHLQSGDYETVMFIPSVDMADLPTYFMSFGDIATMEQEINYVNAKAYEGQVYGVPHTATCAGIVYNKAVFEAAGVTEIPKTPDEFIAALQAIKDNTDAIPLYTNYAAGWTMGSWDDYTGVAGLGSDTFTNQDLAHMSNPFADRGDGTGPYAVYKILYDAVSMGLTEEDYTTTDWEGCKGMINNGEIGCMVLGSWAHPQMCAAGPNADNVGYMPFPITVNGTQYASSGADYSFGINANATDDEKQAALVFVKWMTEESGFAYNESGLPIEAGSTETKLAFTGVTLMEEKPALAGEEDLLNELNAESELSFRAGGDSRIQQVIEHAANGTMAFDDIMADWNQRWSDAQAALGVEVTK
jgi:ABC-type glycerol-3-phosphate transport system substrate-binding protein